MIKFLLVYALICYIISLFSKHNKFCYCGLVGFSGKNNFNLDRIRFLMLWNSVERGRDATGMYSPSNGLVKDSEELRKFVNKQFKEFKEDKTLVAHVRAKTVGANLVANAHPFEYGNIVLAHNGSLEKYHGLASKYSMKAADWDVDSQILAYAVNKNFEENEQGKLTILSEYQGAAALLFYNKDTECLYACHDKNRPLFYGVNDTGMYISSIRESLDALELYTTEFELNTLYTIKDGEIINKEVYKTYEELFPTPPPVRNNRNSNVSLIPNIAIKQRGFDFEDMEARYAVGFNMQAKFSITGGKAQNNETIGHTTKGRWYTVVDTVAGSSYQLRIIDDNYETNVVFYSSLDTENFLPVKGEYVKFIAPIQATKKKISLWSTGDVALVDSVDFIEGWATLVHPVHGKYTVDAKYFRVLDEEERTGFSQEDNSPFFDSVEDNQLAIDRFLQIVREERDDDTPVDITDDTEDEFIDKAIFDNLKGELSKLLNEIEDKIAAGQDCTVEVNLAKAKLSLSNYNFCQN